MKAIQNLYFFLQQADNPIMGKNNSKKSKKSKNLKKREPVKLSKSTIITIISALALITVVTTALVIRSVMKKRLAERTINIAFYGLDEKTQEMLKKQIPQEEDIILNFDVLSDFDTALVKSKYDMLFAWRGEATDSLSKVAEEIPARILETMSNSLSRTARETRCVPIILDHCELTFSTEVIQKLGGEIPMSFNALEKYLKDAKAYVFSPIFCNGAEDRIMIDYVGALMLANGGLSAYNKLIEELRKADSLEAVLDIDCDGKGCTLRSVLDILKRWPDEGFTHPGWYNGRGNDLAYFAEDKQLGCFFTLLSEHRKINYNIIKDYTSSIFPPNPSAENYGLIAPAVSCMLLSGNSNCKRYLAGFFTQETQEELSNLSNLAPVNSRAQAYDRQADDVRFYAASCAGGAIPDLYLAVFQRDSKKLEKLCTEIRNYVR